MLFVLRAPRYGSLALRLENYDRGWQMAHTGGQVPGGFERSVLPSGKRLSRPPRCRGVRFSTGMQRPIFARCLTAKRCWLRLRPWPEAVRKTNGGRHRRQTGNCRFWLPRRCGTEVVHSLPFQQRRGGKMWTAETVTKRSRSRAK